METKTLSLSTVKRIRALSRLAEENDRDAWNHTLRINLYCGVLSRRMGLDGAFCRDIGLMAQMHDIGKMLIDPAILAKPGELTAVEQETVRAHPVLGASLVGPERDMWMARSIALCHHERWDGSGYPRGLRRDGIPLAGRIVALVDVYDALRSRRPYKAEIEHDQSLKIIMKGSGRTRPDHFDPEVLSTFREHHDDFDMVYMSHRDRRIQARAA